MANKKMYRDGVVPPGIRTINKEVAFLMKFKKRFKTKQGFLKAAKDMADEGLIRLGSYDIVQRKLALNKRLTPKKSKEVIKHHVPKVTGSCEDAKDPCAPTRGGGISCTPIARRC